MMNIFLRVENRFVDALQDAYLWLYDRTGVYVATLSFSVNATSMLLFARIPGTHLWVYLMLAGAWALLMIPVYACQDKNLIEVFNARARCSRDSPLRFGILFFCASSIILSTLTMDVVTFAADLICLLSNYVLCVQIRKREPPEKMQLATQGVES